MTFKSIREENQKKDKTVDKEKTVKFYLLFFLFCGIVSFLIALNDNSSDALDSQVNAIEFMTACTTAHEVIKNKLISPVTASFPNCIYSSKDHSMIKLGQNKFMMYGYVDSENIYGAKIRQEWSVLLLQKGNFQFSILESRLFN